MAGKKGGAKLGCNFRILLCTFGCWLSAWSAKLTSGEMVFLERWDSAALAVTGGLVRIQQL
jgi:hypothetical protein